MCNGNCENGCDNMSVFGIVDMSKEEIEKRRKNIRKILRKCRFLIELGDECGVLASLRVLYQNMTIAQADALGVLDDIVEVLKLFEERFGDVNERRNRKRR
jgi:hypothetical protein